MAMARLSPAPEKLPRQGGVSLRSSASLQVEPSGHNDGGTGHVYVDWVWIGTAST
jgi:hypothetical protein